MFNFTFRMNTDGHLKTSSLRQFHAIWLHICLLQPNTILCFSTETVYVSRPR